MDFNCRFVETALDLPANLLLTMFPANIPKMRIRLAVHPGLAAVF